MRQVKKPNANKFLVVNGYVVFTITDEMCINRLCMFIFQMSCYIIWINTYFDSEKYICE